MARSDDGQISPTGAGQAQSGRKIVRRFESVVDIAYASATEPEES